MNALQHGLRIGLLMAWAAGLLGWLSGHTAVLFPDGLRYIRQAKQIDAGRIADGLLKAVDHPIYPAAIVAAHHAAGGDGPMSWQAAAQGASIFAGILLVIPLYLVALELFGARAATLGVFLVYCAPLNGHVMADALSESTFLLFWTWGLWAAIRFLERGSFGWLPLVTLFGGLAYLTRPEGLLLQGALVATLFAMPLLRSTRLNWPRWSAAVAFLVLAPALVIGPYVATKGGIGTKPAIARLLGTAPRSAADAVERARPLDPNETTIHLYASAAKATFEAVRDAISWPLVPFVALGVWYWRKTPDQARVRLLLGIVAAASVLALFRLHATGGYCTARHAMLPAQLAILFGAGGIVGLLDRVPIPVSLLGEKGETRHPGPAVVGLAVAAYAIWAAPRVLTPLNREFGGYRAAGDFVARNVDPQEKVVDLTGWSQFYGARNGYTFANIGEQDADPGVRWVVARDSHLHGPWPYCRRLQGLVGDRVPVATFRGEGDRTARVYVFDRYRPAASRTASRPADRR